jgi:hypothetical protein
MAVRAVSFVGDIRSGAQLCDLEIERLT